MTKRDMLIVALGVAVIAAGTWFFVSKNNTPETEEAPKLSDTVARVNGEEISRDDLVETQANISVSRQLDIATVDDATLLALQTDALDSLVGEALLRQATVAAGFVTPEADVDAELALIKQRFADDAAYQQALADQSTTEAEVRSQIAEGKAAQAYLEQTLSLDTIAPSEEELNALYAEQLVLAPDMPPLEEIREDFASYATGQKQQMLVTDHVAVLRAAAKVEILI